MRTFEPWPFSRSIWMPGRRWSDSATFWSGNLPSSLRQCFPKGSAASPTPHTSVSSAPFNSLPCSSVKKHPSPLPQAAARNQAV